jgi:hypothetical protein
MTTTNTRAETIAFYEKAIDAIPTPKAKHLNPVMAKPITKAERNRNLHAKQMARAENEATKVSLEDARADLVEATGRGEAKARVYAYALIERFGPDYYTFTSANSRTDNEKAHFAAIEAERKACAEAYEAKYGEKGKNMPWSRAKAVAKALREGGEPRQGKPLDARQKATLTTLYKAGMKEERPTDTECDVNARIGELLTTYFNVDLSKLG